MEKTADYIEVAKPFSLRPLNLSAGVAEVGILVAEARLPNWEYNLSSTEINMLVIYWIRATKISIALFRLPSQYLQDLDRSNIESRLRHQY